MNLILRGGEEHQKLKLSQFSFKEVPNPKEPTTTVECLSYCEHGSKNRSGGAHQLNLENMEITHYANSKLKERCYIAIVKLYFSKLPAAAFDGDVFYHKPRRFKVDVPKDEPWFECTIVGHNKLSNMVKEMLATAGIDGAHLSNHSLRATGISRLYNSGVPEKLIMERSGHLSIGAVEYEDTDVQLQSSLKLFQTCCLLLLLMQML